MGVKGVKIIGGKHFPVKTIQYYFPNFKITLMRMHLNNWLKICYMFMFNICNMQNIYKLIDEKSRHLPKG